MDYNHDLDSYIGSSNMFYWWAKLGYTLSLAAG